MSFHYCDTSKNNFKGTLQNTESRKTGSRVQSLKHFSFQSLPKSLQRLPCRYRWRKTEDAIEEVSMAS